MTSKAFEKFFEEQWSEYTAILKMYEAGSPVVDGIDALVPRRTRNVAKKVWNAACAWQRERDARICDEMSIDGCVPEFVEAAQAIREQGE